MKKECTYGCVCTTEYTLSKRQRKNHNLVRCKQKCREQGRSNGMPSDRSFLQ